jgi:hypothetical protein
LITERFTASGGHDDYYILAGENTRNDLTLSFAKIFKAEVLSQSVCGVVERMHMKEFTTE